MGRRKVRRTKARRHKTQKTSLWRLLKWVVVSTVGATALFLIALGLMPKSYIVIIPGHWGSNSGALCPDGLKEVDINLEVARLVAQSLRQDGYSVNLLQEMSSQLKGYRTDLLISIHSDSCVEGLSGFKLAVQAQEPRRTKLEECIRENYARITGLPFHPTTITPDMEEYHVFREVAPSTPAVIIEIGFMGGDRDLLTQHPEVVAEGIVEGVRCFFR